jgi:hypothetical protein
VTCRDPAGGGPVEVGPGDGPLACRPTADSGYLAWLVALEGQGADPEALVDVADAGLERAGADSEFRGELVWHRLQALLAGGHADRALADATSCLAAPEACLGADPGRLGSIRRFAARLALADGDCARALPLLEALPEAEREAADVEWTARCRDEASAGEGP